MESISLTQGPDTTSKSQERLSFGPELAIAISMWFPHWHPGELRPEDRIGIKESKVRGDAALETFKIAAGMGCQIVAVDGGSSPEFLDELTKLGIEIEPQRGKGYSAGRRQSYEAAGKLPGVKVILSTEAEKPSMLLDCLSQEAVQLITDGKADLVIFKRDEESWKTLPTEQAAAEQRSIRVWNKMLRDHGLLDKNDEDLDAWFGPRLINPKIINLFIKRYKFNKRLKDDQNAYNLDELLVPDEWVNSLFFPIIAALQNKLRVRSVTVPYKHPLEQTKSEIGTQKFIDRRRKQYVNIIALTIHYIRMMQGDTRKGRLMSHDAPHT